MCSRSRKYSFQFSGNAATRKAYAIGYLTGREDAWSEQLLREHASEEIVLVGLHNALRFLGEITGGTTTEEILGEIFSTFCIGK